MSKYLIAAFLILITLDASAFGELWQWSSGAGQGVSEYTVVISKNTSLYIACSEDRPVSMIFTVNGVEYGSYADRGFNLIIDGNEVQTPYMTDSRVGAENFIFAWNALRKAKAIYAITSDGKKIALPTMGVANVLPEIGKPEYVCASEL